MAMPESENENPIVKNDAPANHVARQFGTSALGEIAAFSIAIGAVYGCEQLFPRQAKALTARLAEIFGKWRGGGAESQAELAKRILDVGIMNIAGASSMAVQFGIRRSQQQRKEKTSFWYEAGRLTMGRIAGTITAIGTLALIGSKAPTLMKKMESGLSRELGTTAHSDRFAELLVSNTLLSVGAVAGNAPAQLLYDRLVPQPKKGMEK